ncbi:MAG: hypothetical protein WCP19_08425 [Chloroflexota bacterium]
MNENHMDHSLYNQWLLNDESLNSEQSRLLKDHLRNCVECQALSNANLLLRSSGVLAPAAGFSMRFQMRLSARQRLARQRSIIGLIFLVVVSIGLLILFFLPYLPYLVLTPAQLTDVWLKNLVYFALNARVFGAVISTLLPVLAGIIPTYIWISAILLIGCLVPLWAFSFSRIGKYMHSVLEA